MAQTAETPQWRAMEEADIAGIGRLSARIHVHYPEREAVLAEKFRLFPQGCFVLEGPGSRLCGYCFSHPWSAEAPPSLDAFLEALPAEPAVYFIHDLTLDETAQGRHRGAAIVPDLVRCARALSLARLMLVAVNGSEPFWTRMGFRRTADPALQEAARAKYDASAVHMERRLARD